MKTILVPCDFSIPATNAFRFALDVAEKSNATVHLLHVIEPGLLDTSLEKIMESKSEIQADVEQRFEDMMEQKHHPDVRVITEIKFSVVDEALLHYIKDESIEMVIMGSHGVSGFRELFIGSNAERMVRKSPVPVLILKDYFWGPVKDIVFPNSLDSSNQESLVNHVKELQQFFHARLHVVYINTPMNFVSDSVTHAVLDEFAKKYHLQNCTLNVFNHSTVEEGVLVFAKQLKADLIAMGTYGRTGIAHLVRDSVAEDVVNHSQKLVWTYNVKNHLPHLSTINIK